MNDILLSDETIFREEAAFDPDYVPHNILHREQQIDALKLCIKPVFRGSRPINAVILGAPATGKTTVINKVFEEAENETEKLACVHINCQIFSTRFNIFAQIHRKIVGYAPPETGIPFSRVYENIMKTLSQQEKTLLVALDDVNHLFYTKSANKVFYDILRAQEVYSGIKTGLFAVLSDIEFRHMLDRNVSSVFIPQEIIFPPYTWEQMHDILEERVKVGFFPSVLSPGILDDITDYAFANGDLRAGINLLRVSGNIAESHASKKIEKKHSDEAMSKSGSMALQEIMNTLGDAERSLLQTVIEIEEDEIVAGTLYNAFKQKKSISYASYDRLINKLEQLRILDTKLTGIGRKGNSRMIFLRFDPDDLKTYL